MTDDTIPQKTAHGAMKLPVGGTGQRPTGEAGDLRYNSTTGEFEGYTTEWGSIGGGIGDEYISATPTVSSSEANKITVSNHSSYISPTYTVKLGGAVIQHVITSNVITLVNLSTVGTNTITVTVADSGAGKLFSVPASLSMETSDKATTPTVTSSNDREITVTNHSLYPATPTYVVKIGSTVVTHTDSNGTLTLDVNGTAFTGTQTCTVTANHTGANESLGADVSVVVGGALYRYIRLTGFTRGVRDPYLARFEIYSDLNGSDSNNSSKIAGTYHDASSYQYSSGYRFNLSSNTSITSGWYLLGLATSLIPSAWGRIDQQTNSPAVVRSVLIGWYNGSNYYSSTATIDGSNDGTNWTTLKTVTGMTSQSQNSVNL